MDFDYVERDLKAVQNAEWDLNEAQEKYTDLVVTQIAKLGRYYKALTDNSEMSFGEFIDWPYVERNFTDIKCYPATIVGCGLNKDGFPEKLACYLEGDTYIAGQRYYLQCRNFPGVLEMVYNRMIVEVIDRLQEKTYINEPNETLKYDNKGNDRCYASL